MPYTVTCARPACGRIAELTKPGHYCTARCRAAAHRERQTARREAVAGHVELALACDDTEALRAAARRTLALLQQ